ncbi:unnamed protein product [Lathyrus oleraceus]|uniref:MAPK kinase substrate protein n=1 Tax=Pisum sativum TaxID=3888 RepID=A0A9D4W1F9_PEA|nr:MAPK kinase substrate protein At1g80180-like [Pisum sativum]KAI5392506.1 hypothetical protein KIW84_077057 [Pisum sativum]
MASLPRSEVSFRRSGSSGLVWDDRFLSGELNKINPEQHQQQRNSTSTTTEDNNNNNIKEHHAGTTIQRSRSTGAGRGYRTGKLSPPAIDPPSPKISACGFCGPFAKKSRRSKPGTRRSR